MDTEGHRLNRMRMIKRLLALCAAAAMAALPVGCARRSAASALPVQTEPAPQTARQPAPTPKPTLTPMLTPEATPVAEPFSIAWMGDTQAYTAADNGVFGTMTQWISDTQREYNTVLAVHTGDIVYNAFRAYEWQNSVAAFARLPEGMHILTVAGNHDQLPDYDPGTPYLDYRPDTDYLPANAFNGNGYVYYMTFTAGGVPVIVFSLSYGFEVDAADWINEICRQYADHYAILCLHSYLSLGGYTSVGRRLVERVVKQSPNVRLVLCGHERGTAYWPETLDDDADGAPDRIVHQMLMNVQEDAENGVGILRLLRFDPPADTLEVVTYSPVLDRYGYRFVGSERFGDRFGERKLLEDAGIRDFLTQAPADKTLS